jgi:hypothetical protein
MISVLRLKSMRLLLVGSVLRLTAMNVPGRKTVVSTATIFMAELSRLLAAAISLESLASPMLTMPSICAMRLKI